VGAAVTITGTNFGATQGTSTVKFNGTTATPTSWSATSITTQVPAGATTGNVVVTVGGVASNGIGFTVQTDTTPPTAPSTLTATPVSSSGINLSWTSSTDNIGITSYLIERCQNSGCSNFAQIASSPSTSFNDTGLASSTSYTYRVRATDSANNLSPYSNSSSATTSPSSSGGGALPTLVWSKSAANTTGVSMNSYTSNLPTNGTLSGNALIATFQYGSNSGASAAVTDDKGDHLALLVTNSNGNQTVSTYCVLPTPGARVLTISFSGGMPQYVSLINASEWFNLTCTLDGSSSNSDFVTTVSTGPISTTSDGDLLYQAAEEDGSAGSEQWFQGASPWTLLSASRGLSGANLPQATQYLIQTSHGPITPTFKISSADSWNSVAVALKSATSGTPPPAGIRIVHMQEESIPPGQSSTIPLQFPSSGNLIITASNDGPDFDIASISDSNGNAHTQIGSALNDGSTSGDVQTFYAANAVTSSTLAITFSMTGSPTGGSTFFLYDVTGAAAAPFDSTAGRQTATGSQGTTGNIPGPTITPSTPNGLVISQIAVTSNSINGLSPGNILVTLPNPLGQTDPTDENNGWGFEYNTTTAARQYIWTTQGGPVQGWRSTAVAFKAQ
jgi:chitodextrinase